MATSRDPENKAGKTAFKNKYAEMFYKSSVPSVFVTYTPLIIWSYYYGFTHDYITSIGQVAGMFALALFVWTFVEYVMHRWTFHLMEDNPKYERMYYLMHGRHHDHPKDQDRLFMPPIAGLALAGAFFLIFYLILGTSVYAFMPGFIFGYVLYALTHYAMHRYEPPSFLKGLWRNHLLHHFKHPKKGYGVSTTFWDRLFGTAMPRKKQG